MSLLAGLESLREDLEAIPWAFRCRPQMPACVIWEQWSSEDADSQIWTTKKRQSGPRLCAQGAPGKLLWVNSQVTLWLIDSWRWFLSLGEVWMISALHVPVSVNALVRPCPIEFPSGKTSCVLGGVTLWMTLCPPFCSRPNYLKKLLDESL